MGKSIIDSLSACLLCVAILSKIKLFDLSGCSIHAVRGKSIMNEEILRNEDSSC
jgi:hypothetical protein